MRRKFIPQAKIPSLGFLLPASVILAACTAAELRQVAMDAGRTLLGSVVEQNYEPDYGRTMDQLVDVLLTDRLAQWTQGPTGSVTPTTAAATTTGVQPAESTTPVAPARPLPIEFDLAVLREVTFDGRATPVPIEDGEILYDGIGRDKAGDNLKIRFSVNVPCYVYAIWVDATGWATPLFPNTETYSFDNPVEAGRAYTLPGGSDWWYLDGWRGVETLYLVASRDGLPELEQIQRDLIGRERALLPEVTEPVTQQEPTEITRGLAGVRPSRAADVQASDSGSHEVPSTVFVGELTHSDLVVTRWFRHE